jgi:hypothetical protein
MTITHDCNSTIPDPALPIGFQIAAGFGAFVHALVQVSTIESHFSLLSLISALQSLYAFRIYKLTGHVYIPVICWVISAYDLVAGCVSGSEFPLTTYEAQMQYINDRPWYIYSIFVTTAAVDVIIAFTLCYYLKKGARIGMKGSVVFFS